MVGQRRRRCPKNKLASDFLWYSRLLSVCGGLIIYSDVLWILAKFEQFSVMVCNSLLSRAHILVQVTIYRRLRIGPDGHLDQSEADDIS